MDYESMCAVIILSGIERESANNGQSRICLQILSRTILCLALGLTTEAVSYLLPFQEFNKQIVTVD